ncbi:zf-TFIIB domain-containing protein, partial [Nonomuraea turkmeniaca]
MRTYERNGVHIEQCDNCRGIFLDYGELETLTRMETQYHAARAVPLFGEDRVHIEDRLDDAIDKGIGIADAAGEFSAARRPTPMPRHGMG